jgi:hypothetical protein
MMAQTGIVNNQGEPLLNIFPNPCIGDTYLYTDDLDAAWIFIYDHAGNIREQSPIIAGRTLHIHLSLGPGTYQLILKDQSQNMLGTARPLFISTSH